MRTYLYGLVLSRNAHLLPQRMNGIGGAAVRPIVADELTALVGEVEDATASLETVRAHDRVMREIVRGGATAMPVRFGQAFADEAELRRHLDGRARELADTLESMEGHVEMRLLMTLAAESPPVPEAKSPGTAYLESLRSANRVAGLGLRAALGPVVRAERVEELPAGSGVAFAHLIRREEETSYRESVAAHPSLGTAKVIGPLALYAFAEHPGE